jgi:hypothetical protein
LFVGVVVVEMLELEAEGARRDRRDAGREDTSGFGVDIGVDADRIERP